MESKDKTEAEGGTEAEAEVVDVALARIRERSSLVLAALPTTQSRQDVEDGAKVAAEVEAARIRFQKRQLEKQKQR